MHPALELAILRDGGFAFFPKDILLGSSISRFVAFRGRRNCRLYVGSMRTRLPCACVYRWQLSSNTLPCCANIQVLRCCWSSTEHLIGRDTPKSNEHEVMLDLRHDSILRSRKGLGIGLCTIQYRVERSRQVHRSSGAACCVLETRCADLQST